MAQEQTCKKEAAAACDLAAHADQMETNAVDEILARHLEVTGNLISVLHEVQSHYGYLPQDALYYLARQTGIPITRLYSIATFYHFFSLKPPGKHTCTVCLGTACYIKGSEKLVAEAEKLLHIRPGETTPDGEVSLATVRCVGDCGRAPVVLFDGELSAQMDAARLDERLDAWRAE